MTPRSQAELLKVLYAIFPGFEERWLAEIEGNEFASESLHAVYLSFLPFVSGVEASPKQLQLLADLINEAVAAGGDAENAVATCVLEHLRQVGMERSLRPMLSPGSRGRLRT